MSLLMHSQLLCISFCHIVLLLCSSVSHLPIKVSLTLSICELQFSFSLSSNILNMFISSQYTLLCMSCQVLFNIILLTSSCLTLSLIYGSNPYAAHLSSSGYHPPFFQCIHIISAHIVLPLLPSPS